MARARTADRLPLEERTDDIRAVLDAAVSPSIALANGALFERTQKHVRFPIDAAIALFSTALREAGIVTP